MKWKYNPRIKLDIHIPQQFSLLCTILEVNPREIIYQMMCHIGAESFAKGGEDHKTFAKEYFMMCEYGQQKYSKKQIRRLFSGLGAIASLYPDKGNSKMKSLYCNWRDKHYKYFFSR